MSAVTCQKGDILVLEVWTNQGTGGGYFWYDGTSESASDPASYINLSGTISFYTVAGNARVVEYTSSGSTETNIAATTNDTTVLASNVSRTGASIFNGSANSLFLLLSNAVSSSSKFTITMSSNSYYELPAQYNGVVKGFWV